MMGMSRFAQTERRGSVAERVAALEGSGTFDEGELKSGESSYQPLRDEGNGEVLSSDSPPRTSPRRKNLMISENPVPQSKACVVIPEEGSWKLKWDVLMLGLVLYSAVIVPFRLAFDADAEGPVWVFELTLSFCFIADLTIAFFTAVWVDGEWVTDHARIAHIYVSGWFWVDAPSSLPLELLDLLSGEKSQFGFLRFLRMFRLLRLLKLLKIDQIIEQIEEQLDVNLRFLRLVLMVVKVLFVGHFLGCIWFGLSMGQYQRGEETWFTTYAANNGYDHPTTRQLYIWSLYWALTTLTTVGYGDITPRNDAERMFAIVALLVGALIFGFMLSQVATLIASLDRQATLVEEKLDSVKEYAMSRRLPRGLAKKLSKHFKYFLQNTSVFDETELLEQCPPALRAEVTQYVLTETLGKLPLFAKSLDPEFQSELFPHVSPISFLLGEVIYEKGETSRELLFLLQGSVDVLCTDNSSNVDTRLTPSSEHLVAISHLAGGDTKIVVKHTGCFGERLLTGRRRAQTAVAHTYCEALQLTRQGLLDVLAKNPRATRRLVAQVTHDMERRERLRSLRLRLHLTRCSRGSDEWAARIFQRAWGLYAGRFLAEPILQLDNTGLPALRLVEDRRRADMNRISKRISRLSSAYLPSRAAINGLALSEEAQPNRLLPSQASPPKPFTRLRSLDEVIAEEAEIDADSTSRTADGGGGGGKAERFAFGTRLESHGTDGTAAAHLSRAEFEQALAAAEARVMEHVASEFRALRARIGGA